MRWKSVHILFQSLKNPVTWLCGYCIRALLIMHPSHTRDLITVEYVIGSLSSTVPPIG